MASEAQRQAWAQWSALLTSASRRKQEEFKPAVAAVEPPAWHVVVYGEHVEPDRERFESLSDLLVFMAGRDPLDQMWIFYGVRGFYGFAQGLMAQRFFIHPDGRRFPLFDTEPEIIISEDGRGALTAPPSDESSQRVSQLRVMLDNTAMTQAAFDEPDPDVADFAEEVEPETDNGF
jgi:hypothetical protein